MKKNIFLLTTVLVIGGILTGCGKKPSVKLPDLSSLSLTTLTTPDVTDEQVRSYVENQIIQYPGYVKSDRTTCQSGDSVNVSFTIHPEDGTEDYTDDNFTLTIGEGSLPTDVELALTGMKVGESDSKRCLFVDDENGEKSSYYMTYDFTLNYVNDSQTMTYDTLTDDYVKQNFGFDAVNTYVDHCKAILQQEQYSTYSTQAKSDALDLVMQNSEFSNIESTVNKKVKEKIKKTKAAAKKEKKKYADYVDSQWGYTSIDDYKKYLETSIENEVKKDLVIKALIKKESLSDEDAVYEYLLQVIPQVTVPSTIQDLPTSTESVTTESEHQTTPNSESLDSSSEASQTSELDINPSTIENKGDKAETPNLPVKEKN